MAQLKEEKAEQGYSKQQLILGTHTSEGEQNYLMRAEVQLPLEESETDGRRAGDWGEGTWAAGLLRRLDAHGAGAVGCSCARRPRQQRWHRAP